MNLWWHHFPFIQRAYRIPQHSQNNFLTTKTKKKCYVNPNISIKYSVSIFIINFYCVQSAKCVFFSLHWTRFYFVMPIICSHDDFPLSRDCCHRNIEKKREKKLNLIGILNEHIRPNILNRKTVLRFRCNWSELSNHGCILN